MNQGSKQQNPNRLSTEQRRSIGVLTKFSHGYSLDPIGKSSILLKGLSSVIP